MASWILTLPGDDRAALAQITAGCEELKTTRDLVCGFAEMLCHRGRITSGPRRLRGSRCS